MKAIKRFFALMMVAVIAIGLVGCGKISYEDITGDWTTKTIDGQSAEDYADACGVSVSRIASNFTITEDNKVVIESVSGSATYEYERKSNGIEVKEEGNDDVLFSMTYDSDEKTFSYKVDTGNGAVPYVLKKGTTELGEDEGAEDEAQ